MLRKKEKKMHEYPITEQIVKIAVKKCEEEKGSNVKSINLVVGDYSGFVGESIHMYFDLIAKDTICSEAKINIRRVKPKLECPNCGEFFYKPSLSFACPKCGTDGGPCEIGKEFYIETIEIE